jgi:ABC-type transport system involved in cytochrome bd biosynthesis fused ATPase/permease subunit
MLNDGAEADESDLPWLYRLILRFPRLSLEDFPERLQGLFWVLILPAFVIGDVMVNFVFLFYVPFPYNYASVFAFTLILVMLMLRIFLERALNARRTIVREARFRWDVERSLQQYSELLEKQKRDKEEKKPT